MSSEFAAPTRNSVTHMCFGGNNQYDSYASGDFTRWQTEFNRRAEIRKQLARGEITQAQADQMLAADASVDTDALLNKIKQDPSGGMEAREITRQLDVDLGRIGIDKAFTKFDDSYYKGYQNDYTSFYNPQLDRQYNEAVDQMTATLAGRGMLESSVGAQKLADIARQNTEARTNIANEAVDASQRLRGSVENAKSSLYSLNEASANPQAVNAQAIGQATALVAPPTYSPLGQVFASAISSFGDYQNARRNAPTANYRSPYGGSGGGSAKVYS